MKMTVLVLGAIIGLAATALAQGMPMTPEMTPAQRQKMADVHEKMAACLRSDRAAADCHQEMLQSCQATMDGPCTMTMGPMRRRGPMRPVQ